MGRVLPGKQHTGIIVFCRRHTENKLKAVCFQINIKGGDGVCTEIRLSANNQFIYIQKSRGIYYADNTGKT